MQYRHRLCTHENISSCVSQRVSSIVENSLLSETYSSHQVELDVIDVNVITDKSIDVSDFELIRCNAHLAYYVAIGLDGITHYYKRFLKMANTAVLEYKLLVRNSNVPFIPTPYGVLYNWKHFTGEPILVYSYGAGYDRCKTLSMEHKCSRISEENGYFICLSLATSVRDLHLNGYIHNQICPDNIQISALKGYRVGLLDNFSRACCVQTARVFTQLQITEVKSSGSKYCAPEVFSRSSCPTTASDVYSFGKCLFIIGCKQRMALAVAELSEKCTRNSPSQRPTMEQVFNEIASIAADQGFPSVERVLNEIRH